MCPRGPVGDNVFLVSSECHVVVSFLAVAWIAFQEQLQAFVVFIVIFVPSCSFSNAVLVSHRAFTQCFHRFEFKVTLPNAD